MKTASDILESLVDDRLEPSMGSEYMDVARYLARPRGKVATPPAHGSNDSDFGADRWKVDDQATGDRVAPSFSPD